MRLRKRYLPVAMIAGAFLAMLPSVASSETSPTIEAVNTGVYVHSWSPTHAEVGVGGSVTLRNATAVPHGVEWIGPLKGACSSGVPVGTTETASGTEWSGTCTFSQPGTYTFYCTVHHAEMTGTITVSAGGTTTTTTTSTPAPTTPTTSVPTTLGERSTGSALLRAPSFASRQHGGVVRGSLAVSQAGAGDRLEVTVLASGASLGRAAHRTHVRVGRLVRGSVAAGVLPFRVRLNAEARRALKRHKRLALVVRISLTPVYGTSSVVTRTVVEHS